MTDGVTCPLRRNKTVDMTVLAMDIQVADTDVEKHSPNSIVFSPDHEITEITNSPPTAIEITNIPQHIEMDYYSQAFKALSYRSPFDVPDATSGQPSVSSNSVGGSVRLPSRLAQLLNRHTDGKKRQRKSHSQAPSDFKSSKKSNNGRASNIWIETEDYFRELTVEDIEKLHKLSNFSSSGSESYFTIPNLPTCDTKLDSIANGNIDQVKINSPNLNGVEVKHEMSVDDENLHQYMELDNVAKKSTSVVEFDKEDILELKGEECPERGNDGKNERPALSGVEWLLGSRSKIYLTSERPSKKRKLLGRDAGLEKLLVAHPVEGSGSLCHYCSFGDTGDQLNRLIVCTSCGVAVHQRCYGVQEDVRDSWFCSWCKQMTKDTMKLNAERPCSLCSKKNGALKLARKKDSGSKNEGSLEFVHLFCCQWIPEVYVENTRTMEPIMNLDAIKDTRKKLVCCLCKDKCGACVRCSNGACRTSFHPICAREAMHRMEIWGKLGYDEVELRAFCCKHSEAQSSSTSSQHIRTILSAGSNSLSLKNGPVSSSSNLPKLKIGLENGDMEGASAEMAGSELDLSKRKDDVIYLEDLADSGAKSKFKNDAEHAVIKESFLKNLNEDVNPSDSLNFIMVLKMLVERGKVNVKDISNDTGIPVDVLASIVSDNCVLPDLQCKIMKWLKDHTYLGSLRKPLKVKIKSPKPEIEVGDPCVISVVKSVPPRRRTNSSLRILQDATVLSMSKEVSQKDGMGLNEFKDCSSSKEEPDFNNRGPPSNEQEKILQHSMNSHDILLNACLEFEVDPVKPTNGGSENGLAEISGMGYNSSLAKADNVKFNRQFPAKDTLDPMKPELMAGPSVHPHVCKKLLECRVLRKSTFEDCDGGRHLEVPTVSKSLSSGIISDQCGYQCISDLVSLPNGEMFDKLSKTDIVGLSESSPEDEVEGELIFYQNRLICNAVARKRFADDLIFEVVKSIPVETDSVRKEKWHAVSLNQYLYGLREAKKQGRKERRHKEAQVVLAAAAAAAAASSRSSSLRKDFLEDSAQQEDVGIIDTSNGKPVYSSQLISRAKDALLRSGGARLSTEKTSDFLHLALDTSRESSRVCDVCRRSETLLNSIVVCSSCKVAVHLDCYHSVHNFTGPWQCELCEELSSTIGPGAATFNSWGKPYFVPECELCGGTAGAFRKATDGKWIHAFCAEWVLGSSFRRGQLNPVEGMEMISKGHDLCIVCRRDHGVCLKCHYGHCQSTFHPSCGRSAGFYMYSRVIGGKLQNKAYCEKHSLEQRAKAENQRHGAEEMKSLKQVRVELERLRLLCERIIKREKLKRELIICSQHILSLKRENIVLPTRFRHPMLQPGISSESVTTSVKAFPESCKSGSEVMQRSDDVTVDSTVAGKRHINFAIYMDNDQKTDDSSTSQQPPIQKPPVRLSSGGKQIPQKLSPHVSQRPSPPSKSTSDDREKQAKLRMPTETFEKELVMTSDQASMKNQRLPKGYVYVPIKCLSKEKETVPDACPGETDGPDELI